MSDYFEETEGKRSIMICTVNRIESNWKYQTRDFLLSFYTWFSLLLATAVFIPTLQQFYVVVRIWYTIRNKSPRSRSEIINKKGKREVLKIHFDSDFDKRLLH